MGVTRSTDDDCLYQERCFGLSSNRSTSARPFRTALAFMRQRTPRSSFVRGPWVGGLSFAVPLAWPSIHTNPRLYLPQICSHSHGVLLGAHSRLVLLWQNNEEGDLFCADELTTLQVTLCSLTGKIVQGNIRETPPYTHLRNAARLIYAVVPEVHYVVVYRND